MIWYIHRTISVLDCQICHFVNSFSFELHLCAVTIFETKDKNKQCQQTWMAIKSMKTYKQFLRIIKLFLSAIVWLHNFQVNCGFLLHFGQNQTRKI